MMEEGANNPSEGNTAEKGEKKGKGTSNMFMFKIRAFEDVLKLKGKYMPILQPRSFNYLPDIKKANESNEHSKDKLRLRKHRKQPATAEKHGKADTTEDVNELCN